LSGKIEIKHNSNDNTIIQNNQISCAPADITLSNKIFTGYNSILNKGKTSIYINLFKNASYDSYIYEHNFYDYDEKQIMCYSNNNITLPVCSNKCKWELISKNNTISGVTFGISDKQTLQLGCYKDSNSYNEYSANLISSSVENPNTAKNPAGSFYQNELNEQWLSAFGYISDEVSVPVDGKINDEITLQFEYKDDKYIYAKKEIDIYATIKETSIQTDASNVPFNIADKMICTEIQNNEKPSAMLEFYYDNIGIDDLATLSFKTLAKNDFTFECYNSQNKPSNSFTCSIAKIYDINGPTELNQLSELVLCFDLKISYSPQFKYWNNSDDGNYTLKVFKNLKEVKNIGISLSKTLKYNSEDPELEVSDIVLNAENNFETTYTISITNPKLARLDDAGSINPPDFGEFLRLGGNIEPEKIIYSKNKITYEYHVTRKIR
jgi:hypothetical protein